MQTKRVGRDVDSDSRHGNFRENGEWLSQEHFDTPDKTRQAWNMFMPTEPIMYLVIGPSTDSDDCGWGLVIQKDHSTSSIVGPVYHHSAYVEKVLRYP